MSATSKRGTRAGKLVRTLSAGQKMHRHADEAIALLKAMASHNRLLLLCQLVQGECSVGGLAQSLDLAQSVVSQHLSLLRRDGVVSGRREAQTIYYRISDERVQALMSTLFEQFCGSD
ncbi:MAG TPA: metalloregulator ArsR/SmtB family transcription factor [Rhodanobacter sp.]|jgi:DNA-binding transcriptional ArsR family regulator|nr:metalloregulator ArsR/SmtB family transcription factor [Rhodanobacter sp.]